MPDLPGYAATGKIPGRPVVALEFPGRSECRRWLWPLFRLGHWRRDKILCNGHRYFFADQFFDIIQENPFTAVAK